MSTLCIKIEDFGTNAMYTLYIELKTYFFPKWNGNWLKLIPTSKRHLIFEIFSLKNQVWRTGFFVYFELDFYCLRSLQKSFGPNVSTLCIKIEDFGTDAMCTLYFELKTYFFPKWNGDWLKLLALAVMPTSKRLWSQCEPFIQ